MLTKISSKLTLTKSFKFVLSQLINQQMTLRYRRTILGFLWTLINPLIMMTVSAVVFSTIFKMDLKVYTIYLFAGMIPWNCFNAIITQSGGSLINNEGLIKKIYLPKIIFPLSVSLGIIIDSALSFVAFFLIILALGGKLSWTLFFIPFAFFTLFIFSLGIALITSIATVFFRDLQHVIIIFMQALFFLTPIMYKNEALAGKVAWLINLNPLIFFIELFRTPIYNASLPDPTTIFLAAIFALGSLTIGLLFFSSQQKKIIFRI